MVTIYYPAIFRGPKATEENIAKFKAQIRSKWQGNISDYTVNVEFIDGGYRNGGKWLQGNIVYMDAGGVGVASYHDWQRGLLAWNIDSPLAPAHEFGHAMQNKIHYTNKQDLVDYPDNVMVKNQGRVEGVNILDALDAWGYERSAGFIIPGGKK